jgi:hypothetical protein
MEHECPTTLVRCFHCDGLKPLMHEIWILEIPKEPTFLFTSFAALKEWVAESEECPVDDFFGEPITWVAGGVTNGYYATYHSEGRNTDYMYAHPKEVTA